MKDEGGPLSVSADAVEAERPIRNPHSVAANGPLRGWVLAGTVALRGYGGEDCRSLLLFPVLSVSIMLGSVANDSSFRPSQRS